MTTTTPPRPQAARPAYDIFRPDHPGWIPEWVGDDWDPHPYAYQTREQLMPAVRFHSLYLKLLSQMLDPLLERLGLCLILDVFIFYRDWERRKQRIAPDAVIAQAIELNDKQLMKSYDLDDEPLPLSVIEVTSPRGQLADRRKKRLIYAMLGIREYLLVDTVDDEDEYRLRKNVDLYLWRLEQETPVAVEPDAEGFLTMETVGVRLRTEGRRLIAQVAATGELLRASSELLTEIEALEKARVEAEQRAQREAAGRLADESELERLRAELARLRGEG